MLSLNLALWLVKLIFDLITWDYEWCRCKQIKSLLLSSESLVCLCRCHCYRTIQWSSRVKGAIGQKLIKFVVNVSNAALHIYVDIMMKFIRHDSSKNKLPVKSGLRRQIKWLATRISAVAQNCAASLLSSASWSSTVKHLFMRSIMLTIS